MLYLVAIGWMYVVLMMSVAEALAPSGSLLGALVTLVFYGILPLALVFYLMATPARRKALRAREQAQISGASGAKPDGSSHPAGDAVATKREEP